MQNHNSNKDNKSSNRDSKSKLIGLDTARLLAMLMMMQGHTVYALLDKGVIEAGMWYWSIWTFIRGLTAPVFLMVSGAVHIFANKRDENGILPNATIKKEYERVLFSS